MASKFGAIFRFILIVIVVSGFNNISLFAIAIEPTSEAKNHVGRNDTVSPDLKRDRINFNSLKFLTVVQDDKNDTIFRFDEYYNTTQIYDYMDRLQQKFETLVEILPIGQTWENRSIKTLKISSGNSNNSAIWIDGGIHAREWISISSVLYIMNVLLTNWFDLDPAFRKVDYYLTPVLNPDGYEYSQTHDRYWRRNRRKMGLCYGVDLNRNFPYKWNEHNDPLVPEEYRQKTCGSDLYPGLAPSSEPETEAVTKFITRFPNKFKGFLTFHTYGQDILYPYGYDFRIPKSFVKLNHIAQAAADKIFNVTGLTYNVRPGSKLYVFAGSSLDWAYKVAKIPYSYLVELRDTDSFELPPSEIVPAGKEALIIAMTLVDNFDSSAQTPISVPDKSYYENLLVESDE